MKIFILPGGTSPYGKSQKHCRSYRDIAEAAKRIRPDAEVQIVVFPGQLDVNGVRDGELAFNSSLRTLRNEIDQNQHDEIRLVCVCWGCQIGAAACADDSESVPKALFWAPLPYWKLYETCVLGNDLWAGQEEHRGVKVTPRVLDGIIPFELSIQKIAHANCLAAAGTNDEYVSPASLRYFESIVSKEANLRFQVLNHCGHTMIATDPYWSTFETRALRWVLE